MGSALILPAGSGAPGPRSSASSSVGMQQSERSAAASHGPLPPVRIGVAWAWAVASDLVASGPASEVNNVIALRQHVREQLREIYRALMKSKWSDQASGCSIRKGCT